MVIKGSLKNYFTFWEPMHPVRLRYENSEYPDIPAFSRLNAQKLRTYFFANPKAGRVGSKRQLETETTRRRAGRAVFRANDGRPSNPLTSCIPDFYNYDVVHGVHGLKVSPVGRKGGLRLVYCKFLHYPG
jgi:hypothetical protein